MKLLENYKRIDIDDYLTDELSDAAVRYIKKQVKANQKFWSICLIMHPMHLFRQPLNTLIDFLKLKIREEKNMQQW